MSKILILAALCGALSGGLSYAVISLAQPTHSAPVQVAEAAKLTVAAAPTEGWREEIEKLRVENSMLAQRLAGLEAGQVGGARTALQAPGTILSSEEVAAIKSLIGDGAATIDAAPPVIYSSVKGALEDIRAQEEADRDQKRREQEAERLERDLEKMATALTLDGFQTGEMRRILTDRNDLRNQFMTAMRDGTDMEALRDSGKAAWDNIDSQIKSTLSSDQYSAYQDQFSGRGGRGGWGAGPGFGGGGRRND